MTGRVYRRTREPASRHQGPMVSAAPATGPPPVFRFRTPAGRVTGPWAGERDRAWTPRSPPRRGPRGIYTRFRAFFAHFRAGHSLALQEDGGRTGAGQGPDVSADVLRTSSHESVLGTDNLSGDSGTGGLRRSRVAPWRDTCHVGRFFSPLTALYKQAYSGLRLTGVA